MDMIRFVDTPGFLAAAILATIGLLLTLLYFLRGALKLWNETNQILSDAEERLGEIAVNTYPGSNEHVDDRTMIVPMPVSPLRERGDGDAG